MVNFKVTSHCITDRFKLPREEFGVKLRWLLRDGFVCGWDAPRSCPGSRSVLLSDTSGSAVRGQKKALPAQQLWKDELLGFRGLSKQCVSSLGVLTGKGNQSACSGSGSRKLSIKLYLFTQMSSWCKLIYVAHFLWKTHLCNCRA